MTQHAAAWSKWFPTIERAARDVSLCMLESAGVAPGHRVLDLATGIGEPALSAAKRVGPGGHVLGVDVSADMIDIARARAEAAGLTNAEFRVKDVEALALSETFDAALCRWGLMFVDDLAGTLERVHATLIPGGRLSISVWASADEVPTLSLAERAAHHALGLPPPDEGAQTPFALCDVAALGARLEHAGFEEVVHRRVPVVFEFASPEDFVVYRRELSTRFAATTAGLRETNQQAARQAVVRAVEPYLSPAGKIRMENWVYCISATRP